MRGLLSNGIEKAVQAERGPAMADVQHQVEVVKFHLNCLSREQVLRSTNTQKIISDLTSHEVEVKKKMEDFKQ